MNTKFFFVLLAALIVLTVAACAPAITDISEPIAVPPIDEGSSALMPVTGNSAAESVRTESESRLWSGEIFQSDNGNPDYVHKVQPATNQKARGACMSDDSQPRRHGGCVE